MARAELTFLNEREEALIHEQSIETLETIGVRVQSQSVLKLLEEKGAALLDHVHEVVEVAGLEAGVLAIVDESEQLARRGRQLVGR